MFLQNGKTSNIVDKKEKSVLENTVLLNDGENQPLITNYFKIVDKIYKYINENNIFNES